MYKLVFYTLKLFSFLPLKVSYFFADILYFIIHYIVKYRLQVVRNNINNSFPEKTKEEKRKIEIGFYHHFSDMLVEIPKLLTMSHKEIQRRIKFENYETMLKQYNDGKSVILMAAHCGNWEWMTSLSLILPDDKPMYQVYKKLKQPQLKYNDTKNRKIRFRSKYQCRWF